MGEAWACLLLRLWVGMRLFFAGITKWKSGASEFKAEAMKLKMNAISEQMATNTPIPRGMTDAFANMLPYALVAAGALIIVGLFTRLSLIAGGFIFLSLAFGLMMLPDDKESVFRGIEIALVAGALALSKYNILAVDNLIGMALYKAPAASESTDKDSDKA
jgi:thiosulfate dehydrogenase [quinone] large subunit